jgi:serine/threonine-protein kinase
MPIGGFTPGTVIGERYRIIGLLGRGGMGEVYRADDLKLGQPVALKFLPESLAEDPVLRERFFAEVRIARQISHPNVCRVYDVAELEGQHCLSMEYIDGEDLGSLLTRIGRLPIDKALDISRQICAGLAAAHEKGVLHRDLKPSNIMLDGRGRARITDFGLAVVAEEASQENFVSGTPAYLAPEQLAGKGASVRSDIYALGMVLYELYTGKRAFEAGSLAELRNKKENAAPTPPSQMVKEMDPVVERVILRCLDNDPRARPPSALQVAAALPGADPLAAALAAGETPSPETVAASGGVEGLKPRLAWACLAVVLIGLMFAAQLNVKATLLGRVRPQKPPEVLIERAREILKKAGYTDPPADFAFGFEPDRSYVEYIREHDQSRTRWDRLEGNAINFWYRQSPQPIEPATFPGLSISAFAGIYPNDPPVEMSGMATVWLNPQGRLSELIAVPPQVDSSADTPVTLPWDMLMTEAGVDPARYMRVPPAWLPPTFSDSRSAWEEPSPYWPGHPIRIEAAAFKGKPVYFKVIGPWTWPSRMVTNSMTSGEHAQAILLIAILLTLFVGGAFFARRNLRLGRGDRRGASRLAVFVITIMSISWILGESHVATMGELGLAVMFASWTLFVAVFIWILYVALEPFVRRRWPATIVSWSRLLAGEVRDPLVGRDLLFGSAFGAASSVIILSSGLLPSFFGRAPETPLFGLYGALTGGRNLVSGLLWIVTLTLFVSLAHLFLLFLLRTVLRKQWAAAAAYILILAPLRVLQSSVPWEIAFFVAAVFGLYVFVLMRFGLLAFIACQLVRGLVETFPITTQFSLWYSGYTLLTLAFIGAIAFFGFYTSLGGHPLLGKAVLED